MNLAIGIVIGLIVGIVIARIAFVVRIIRALDG
jgi:hypothetical protein